MIIASEFVVAPLHSDSFPSAFLRSCEILFPSEISLINQSFRPLSSISRWIERSSLTCGITALFFPPDVRWCARPPPPSPILLFPVRPGAIFPMYGTFPNFSRISTITPDLRSSATALLCFPREVIPFPFSGLGSFQVTISHPPIPH